MSIRLKKISFKSLLYVFAVCFFCTPINAQQNTRKTIEENFDFVLKTNPSAIERKVVRLQDSLNILPKTEIWFELNHYKIEAWIQLTHFVEAYRFTDSVLQFKEIERNPFWKAKFMASYGKILSLMELHDEATEKYLEAEPLFIKLKNENELALFYVSMSEAYRRKRDFNKQGYYLDRAFPLVLKQPDNHYVLGRFYNRKAEFLAEVSDSAEYFSLQAIREATLANDLNTVASSYNELGFYYGRSNHELAEEYYQKAVNIFWETGDTLNYVHAQLNYIGDLAKKSANNDSKIKPLLDSVKLILGNHQWYYQQMRMHRLYFDYFKQKKMYDSAFHYNWLNSEWKTEYVKARADNKAFLYRIKYDNEKSQHIISQKENELVLERNAGDDKLTQRNWFIAISLLALGFSIICIWLLVKLRKSHAGLSKQANEIELINEELSDSLQQKNVLFSEVHHRVKNNLMVVSGLMELHAEETDDPTIAAKYLECMNRIRSMGLVHELIYTQNNISELDICEYVETLAQEIIQYKSDKIDLKINCEPINFSLENAIPFGIIMNELITNSLKHALQKDIPLSIYIDMHHTGKEFVVTYRDNGPGIPAEMTKNKHSIGLYLLNRMSQQLNGKLEMKNDNGAVFIITFLGRKTK